MPVKHCYKDHHSGYGHSGHSGHGHSGHSGHSGYGHSSSGHSGGGHSGYGHSGHSGHSGYGHSGHSGSGFGKYTIDVSVGIFNIIMGPISVGVFTKWKITYNCFT